MTTEHTSGGLIGRSVRRVEDPVLITGKGRYVDDMQLPGMLHMASLRSPHPHADHAYLASSQSGVCPTSDCICPLSPRTLRVRLVHDPWRGLVGDVRAAAG